MSTASAPVHITQRTQDAAEAEQWFEQFEGAGLDGVVAKRLDGKYVPNGRTMLKVKHSRTADVVVAGYRLHKTSTPERPLLGSMLLGLYADDGRLQHVGVCASFSEARRAELLEELEPLRVEFADHPWGAWQDEAAQASGRLPGGQSRWSGGKDLSFVPLAPKRVVEVGYEHMEGDRFRHTAQFKRWRDDREPESCGYAQLEEVARYDLSDVLALDLPAGERRDAVVRVGVRGCLDLGFEGLAAVVRGERLRHEGVAALGHLGVELDGSGRWPAPGPRCGRRTPRSASRPRLRRPGLPAGATRGSGRPRRSGTSRSSCWSPAPAGPTSPDHRPGRLR